MADPGRPPKPRSSNLGLLETLVTEEEERDKNKGVPTSIPTAPGADNSGGIIDHIPRHTDFGDSTEMKEKSISTATADSGKRQRKVHKHRSRSSSSERGKHTAKRERPFSADYKQHERQPSRGKASVKKRPGSSKHPTRMKVEEKRSRSPDYSSDTFTSDDSSNKDRKDDSDVFFDSDKDEKKIDSDSFFDSDRDRKDSDKVHHRGSREKVHAQKSHGKKRDTRAAVNGDRPGRSRSDSESSDYQRRVSVEDYSLSDSSDSERENKSKQTTVIVPQERKAPAKPKNKKLLNRRKVTKYHTVQLNPDQCLQAKITQKYVELEELLESPFVDPKAQMTREHVYQMELLRQQYQSVSHGLAPGSVLIPRSLPGNMRNKKSGQQRPHSGKRDQHNDTDPESYDNAYYTIRSVMAAENARQTDRVRTDMAANRPASGKKTKKKKLQAKLKTKESESEEEPSERSDKLGSTVSKTSTGSNRSSPRLDKITIHVDDHIKYSKNERLKQWLKEKDRLYRRQVKEERHKKREEREKSILEANDKLERKLNSDKKVKRWMKEKGKELAQQHKEERAQRRREEKERKQMEVNLPGDSLRIRPQSAPPTSRSTDGEEVDRESIRQKKEEEEERRQARLAKERPHPPQTKFIYKRPVAGKIKFTPQPALQTGIVASKYGSPRPGTAQRHLGESHEEMDKRLRLSYDDWLKKKAQSDVEKKKEAQRKRQLAKSDPELDRIVPEQARRRISNQLKSRKRVDTGLKDFDRKLNRSFGGADHGEESGKEVQRPRSAYRLQEDSEASDQPALTVKQITRPQTAPSGRGRVILPKKSASSPRKAVVPKKVDAIMAEEHTTNAFSLPFPPEMGVPKHVDARQRKLFADRVSERLSEEQGRQQPPETMPEGQIVQPQVSRNSEPSGKPPSGVEADRREAQGQATVVRLEQEPPVPGEEKDEKKSADGGSPTAGPAPVQATEEHPPSPVLEASEPETLMGSQPESVSQAEPSPGLVVDQVVSGDTAPPAHSGSTKRLPNITSEETLKEEWNKFFSPSERVVELQKEGQEGNQYLVSTSKEDIADQVIQRMAEALLLNDNEDEDEYYFDSEPAPYNQMFPEEEETIDDVLDQVVPEVVSTDPDTGAARIGILKESKKTSDQDLDSAQEQLRPSEEEPGYHDDSEDLPSPRQESGSPSRKRVSFSEKMTVFESAESSSSTDTITPEQPGELNASIDGLDAQPDLDDAEYEKVSFNIGGFELNPAVIKTDEAQSGEDQEPSGSGTADNGEPAEARPVEGQEPAPSTFITSPGESEL